MHHWAVPFPLALGFVTTAFAWAGLGLISIPIIIHLLNRRRFKTHRWAAMEFLLKAMRKNRKRLKFEQWLLLATRCLVVALLGLALARPLGCANSNLARALGGSHTGLNVFVIDNAYPTGYQANRPGAKTHLDREKQIARALIDEMGPDQSIAIITAAKPAAGDTGILMPAGFDKTTAHNALDRLAQSYTAPDMGNALQRAIDLANNSGEKIKNLYLLTDGTRATWLDSATTQGLKDLGPKLEQTFAHISHFNMSRDLHQPNTALTSITAGRNLITTVFPTPFLAKVAGFDIAAAPKVKWSLDGKAIVEGVDSPTDPSGGTATLSEQTFTVGGPHTLEADLQTASGSTPDALEADNSYYHVFNVAAKLKVLIVEGKHGIDILDGSGQFLKAALAPVDPDTQKAYGYVDADLISDLDLPRNTLTDYRVICMTDVSQVTPVEADLLERFVDQGGTLMWFMGPEVNRDSYNAVLGKRGLLPGILAGVAKSEIGRFSIDFKKDGHLHPLLAVFAHQEDTGLDTADTAAYMKVDVSNPNVERVLNFVPHGDAAKKPGAIGDPAFTVQSVGLGRVVFSALPANLDWGSTLPNKMAYTELMHELLDGSVRTDDYWMNLTVGQQLRIPATVGIVGTPVLKNSKGVEVPISLSTSASTSQPAGQINDATPPAAISKAITTPGIYSLTLGNSTVYPIAVNVPAAQGADIRGVPDEAIEKALGSIHMTMLGSDIPSSGIFHQDDNDFGWDLMLILLALLGVECYMAMRFGHHRRAARGAAPVGGGDNPHDADGQRTSGQQRVADHHLTTAVN